MAEHESQPERTYPIGLRVAGRRCLIVGGGEVAARKAAGLLECGADVHAVAPTFVEALRDEDRITRHVGEYDAALLEGAVLVIAATDEPAVNHRVAADARARGIASNVVDDPAACDFFCPAVVRRGPLAIAIHSGGAAPALARRLREQLDGQFDARYGSFVEALGRARRRIQAEVADAGRRAAMRRRLGGADTEAAFFSGGEAGLWQCLNGQGGAP
jgi:precorrin-2 dehydrogenase/sirohydrochlorin ferrochelatase